MAEYRIPPVSEQREHDKLVVEASKGFYVDGKPIRTGQTIHAPRFLCRILVENGLALWSGEEVIVERDAEGELVRAVKRKISTSSM